MTAARRYKGITGGMTDVVTRMRAADTQRAARLAERLVELHAAMSAAGERAALSEFGLALQWEAALEALWDEHWMTLRPLPTPDFDAPAHDLDYLDAMVAQCGEALRELTRRRPLLGRR